MLSRLLQGVLLFGFLFSTAAAQVLSFPTSPTGGAAMASNQILTAEMDFNIFTVSGQNPGGTPLQSPSGSVSKLDLKAPSKAQREYEKGYQLLMRKDIAAAIEHLSKATVIYPSFVAAHNALGTAYLNLSQNEEARGEFDKAVTLDDHLPNSYLNLGCANLALKDYAAAEDSLRKASSIAPLDLQLLTALAYGEFANHDYPAVIATTREVHGRKHKGAALVHFFAAGAWEAQDNLSAAQHEMETLLGEDPNSPSAEQFRQILGQIKAEQTSRAEAKLHPPQPVTVSFSSYTPTAEEGSRQARQVLQDLKEKSQIAEAEAEPDATCVNCGTTVGAESGSGPSSVSRVSREGVHSSGFVLRAVADEVAVFFAATDHGKSVTDLTASDIGVSDDGRPPNVILGFRNESQLPLRLGLVIDTSNSVSDRFSFEQAAASRFLQKVVTGKDDLTFVVGVNNSILLVQDFTEDQTKTTRAVNQLAPGGGTALWDAVAFAADKLANRREEQPVARVLVVISDGKDNSSSSTLKEAIEHALRGEVAIYTVSTRDLTEEAPSELLGDHALKTLSELTGGAAFVPGSLGRLGGAFAGVEQVIRGRYLVAYKPAAFQRDGRYRAIDVKAQKDGHQLKVYARKGYYASAAPPGDANQ
jgi:VWFA-related protein